MLPLSSKAVFERATAILKRLVNKIEATSRAVKKIEKEAQQKITLHAQALKKLQSDFEALRSQIPKQVRLKQYHMAEHLEQVGAWDKSQASLASLITDASKRNLLPKILPIVTGWKQGRTGFYDYNRRPYKAQGEIARQEVLSGASWTFFDNDVANLLLKYKKDKGHSIFEPTGKGYTKNRGYISALQAGSTLPNWPLEYDGSPYRKWPGKTSPGYFSPPWPTKGIPKVGSRISANVDFTVSFTGFKSITFEEYDGSFYNSPRVAPYRQLDISHPFSIPPTRLVILDTVEPMLIILKIGWIKRSANENRLFRAWPFIKVEYIYYWGLYDPPSEHDLGSENIIRGLKRRGGNHEWGGFAHNMIVKAKLGDTIGGKTTIYFTTELSTDNTSETTKYADARSLSGGDRWFYRWDRRMLTRDWWIVQVEWRTDDIVEFWRDTYLNRRAPQPPSETT